MTQNVPPRSEPIIWWVAARPLLLRRKRGFVQNPVPQPLHPLPRDAEVGDGARPVLLTLSRPTAAQIYYGKEGKLRHSPIRSSK